MKQIRWFEPVFDQEDINEVTKVLEAAYVNEGPKTKELEEELKKYLHVNYIVLTTNATAALFLAIKAEAIARNVLDFEVIVPDLTMFASATSVSWAGGRPILVDVKEDNFTIDLDKVKEKINDKTIAIMPVHILGRAADMDNLIKIASEKNLAIIEDAAGSLGSKYKGKFLGTIGKVGCFSLQSNKIITCGQGGIIATNDFQIYEIIRRLRDFGRFSNKEMLHHQEGYNLKFNDLSAALALSQFNKLELRKELLTNQRDLYENNLKNIPQICFPKLKEGEIPLWIDVIVHDRENLVNFLKSFQIYPRECWPAVHFNLPFANQGTDADFIVSSNISKNCIWLPNGPNITKEDIGFVCEKINEFYSP